MTARWTIAQARQAARQPAACASAAVAGQPIVEAKPAISVMPVIGPRASRPYRCASAANAVS